MNTKLFTVNETEVTLSSIVIFILLFVGFILISRFFSRKVIEQLLSKFHIQKGTKYVIRRLVEYTLIILSAIIAFQTIGINLSGLAVIFGLLSVGIGFGLQNVTSNFIAGLILLFERPITVGDRITVGDTEGDVIEINMRSTTIRSLNNIAIIVPNSEFVSSQVVNWSHGDMKVRLDIDVGVSYRSDLDLVIDSLKEVAKENDEIMKKPKPEVHLRQFGDSAWHMQLRGWIKNPQRHYHVTSDVNCAIVRKFRKNGIEIPYPQRDFHLRSSVKFPVDLSEKK